MIGTINAVLVLVMLTFSILHMFPRFRKNGVVSNILVGIFLAKSILYFIEGKWGWGIGDMALAGVWLFIGYMGKQTSKMSTTLADLRDINDMMEEHRIRILELLNNMDGNIPPVTPKKRKIEPPKDIKRFDFKNKDYGE